MSFDSTINVGHLIELAVIFAGLVAGYFRLDKRLAVVEAKLELVLKNITGDS